MKLFRFTMEQFVPAGIEKVWPFFSDPANLQKITPPHMNFQIISGGDEPMHAGQIIVYKVSPLPGLRLNWITEITNVEPGVSFVDEQRSGPYRMWHHRHVFIPAEGGILMKDIIHYALPFGLPGRWSGQRTVKRRLEQIFDYRRQRIEEMYGQQQVYTGQNGS